MIFNLRFKVLGPKLMFAKRDKHYPSRSGQTIARAVTNFTKPVTKNNFEPNTEIGMKGVTVCLATARQS